MTKILLSTFVLTGVVDSTDEVFATVEINLNPPIEQASMAIVPVTAFPCEIKEGTKFYILKLTEQDLPVIICGEHKPVDNKGENK